MTLIPIEPSGYVVKERIVALGRADASGMKRLLTETAATHKLDLTFGKKRKSVVVLESGHVVITALTLEQLHRLIAPDEGG